MPSGAPAGRLPLPPAERASEGDRRLAIVLAVGPLAPPGVIRPADPLARSPGASRRPPSPAPTASWRPLTAGQVKERPHLAGRVSSIGNGFISASRETTIRALTSR